MERRRTAVLLLSLGFAAFGASWGSLNAVVAELKRAYGLDEGVLGVLLVLPPVVGAVIAMRGTAVVSFLGCRRMIGCGSALLACGLLVLAAEPGRWAPWASLAAMGAGSGMMDVGILTGGSRVEASGGPGVLGRIQSLFFVGLVAGGAVGTAGVGSPVGYRGTFVAVAVAVLCVGGVVLARLEEPPDPHVEARQRSVREALALPGVAILFALAFGGFLLEGAATSWTAVLVRDELRAAAAVASASALAVNLGLAIGAFSADAAMGRLGIRRTMSVGALLAAAGVAVAAAATSPGLAIAAMLVAAIGFGGIGPSAFTLTGRIDVAHGGGILPTITALAYVAFLIGPVGVGQLGQLAGLRIAFAVVAAAAAALAVLAAVARLPVVARS